MPSWLQTGQPRDIASFTTASIALQVQQGCTEENCAAAADTDLDVVATALGALLQLRLCFEHGSLS